MKVIAKIYVEVTCRGEVDAAEECVFMSPRFIKEGDVTDLIFEDDALSVAVEAKVF